MCPPDSEMLVKHLSVAINKWKYRLQYHDYFGGVSAISKIHFKRVRCNLKQILLEREITILNIILTE